MHRKTYFAEQMNKKQITNNPMKKLLMCALLLLCAGVMSAQEYAYVKVKTVPSDWTGEYLIVREIDSIATGVVFDGSLTDLDEKNNCFRVAISSDKRIASTTQTDAATFTISQADASKGTWYIRSKSGFYIGYNKADSANLGYNKDPKYVNTIAFENDTTSKVKITAAGGYVLRYNKSETSNRFRYYAEGKKKAIHLYKKQSITALQSCAEEQAAPIDGSLYFLPKGFWIQSGRLLWLPNKQ